MPAVRSARAVSALSAVGYTTAVAVTTLTVQRGSVYFPPAQVGSYPLTWA